MKRIIATTAMALMVSTAAFAENHAGMLKTYEVMNTSDIYASKFIGMRVYANETDWDSWDANSRVEAGAEQEWDDIGEVNDVILGRDGTIKAVVLGVGGFIGIGEKDVAVTMEQIKMVPEKDDEGDFFLVVKANKDMLTNAEAFEATAHAEEMKADATEDRSKAEGEVEEAKADVDDASARDDMGRPMMIAPQVEREGYREAELAELTAEVLQGARVYGAKDEDVGEISQLILSDDGKIDKVVIDVGGFLGIGEHPVGVTFEELKILRTDDGSDFRVYIDSNQEALEKQPAYKAKT